MPAQHLESLSEGISVSDPRWQCVENLVTTVAFSRSPRLAQLLRYLVIRTLAGRGREVTEPEIAMAVFDRGNDFDRATDTIVRSHMLRLR